MAFDKTKVYTSTQINPSPTISGVAGADIEDVRLKGVKHDAEGRIVLADTAGETIIGVAIITNATDIKKGQDVDIQVKDIGAVLAGGAITTGAELAVDTAGSFVAATAGQFVAAIALEPGNPGQVVRAQMTKYMKAAASTPAAPGGEDGK